MHQLDHIESLVGSIRRFGPYGVTYEVLGFETQSSPEPELKIRVFETGEETSYKVSDALKDPQES